MFSALFGRRPPLEENAVRWLFEAYGWAFRNLSGGIFHLQTCLVLADGDHFPEPVASVQGTAELLFDRTAEYAGMAHWPWQVVEAVHLQAHEAAILPRGGGQAFHGARRLELERPLPVTYEPCLVANREALVAHFSRTLAGYLARTLTELPPGGAPRWSHGIDLLTVFLGFGLVYANTLPLVLAGRSGGEGATAGRDHLSRWDLLYALAIFCVLKGIPRKEVQPRLKRPLRGFFQRAYGDVQLRRPELGLLRRLGQEGMEQPRARRA